MAHTSTAPRTGLRAQASNAGAIFVIALFLVVVSTPVFFSFGTTLMSPTRLFLTVAFVPLAIMLVSDKSLKINLVDIFLVSYLAWTLLLAVAPRHPNRLVEWGGSLTLEILGAYLVARVCVRNRETFIAFAKLFGLFVVVTLPFAIVESQTGLAAIPNYLGNTLGWNTVADIDNPPRLGLERAQVNFAHPIHYGVFTSMAFAMTWVALAGEIGPVRRGLTTAAVFACSFLSLSSGAFLPVVLQIGLIGWYVATRNVVNRWRLFFILLISAYVLLDIAAEASPIRVLLRYVTFSEHTARWRVTIFEWGMKNVWSSPWIGIGLVNWERPHWMRSASMDNYWLVHAMRSGIPSFLLMAAAFLTMLIRLGRRDFSGDEQLNRLRRAYIFTVSSLILSLATVHVWANIQAFVFFFLGTGAWMLTATPRGAEPPPPEAGRGVRARSHAGDGPRYTRFPQAGRSGGRGPATATAASGGGGPARPPAAASRQARAATAAPRRGAAPTRTTQQ